MTSTQNVKPQPKTEAKPRDLVEGTDNIKKLIDSVHRRNVNLVEDIQTAAMSSVMHAHKHGDYTLVSRLHAGLSTGMKQKALKLWLLNFAPIIENTDKATKKVSPFAFSAGKVRKDYDALVSEMEAVRWDAAPTEDGNSAASYYDAMAALKRIAKQCAGNVAPGQAALAARLIALHDEVCA